MLQQKIDECPDPLRNVAAMRVEQGVRPGAPIVGLEYLDEAPIGQFVLDNESVSLEQASAVFGQSDAAQHIVRAAIAALCEDLAMFAIDLEQP